MEAGHKSALLQEGAQTDALESRTHGPSEAHNVIVEPRRISPVVMAAAARAELVLLNAADHRRLQRADSLAQGVSLLGSFVLVLDQFPPGCDQTGIREDSFEQHPDQLSPASTLHERSMTDVSGPRSWKVPNSIALLWHNSAHSRAHI
jgi:hypothetical protein